jgi:hypothetical protein
MFFTETPPPAALHMEKEWVYIQFYVQVLVSSCQNPFFPPILSFPIFTMGTLPYPSQRTVLNVI